MFVSIWLCSVAASRRPAALELLVRLCAEQLLLLSQSGSVGTEAHSQDTKDKLRLPLNQSQERSVIRITVAGCH